MIRQIFHRLVGKFERGFNYDATYLHEVVDVSPSAFIKFGLFQFMSAHRENVPKEAWHAARIAAALSEDCGPCAQLIVDAALRDGMAPQAIASLLRGDLEQAGPDAELGFRYGMAVATNAPEAPTLAGEAETRYGKRALVSLAFAVACSRVYPALKRGLGHGAACSQIVVDKEKVIFRQAA